MPTPVPASGRTLLISGATGFIGRHLVRRLRLKGDNCIVLTRNPPRARALLGPDVRVLENLGAVSANAHIDALVNLAGARILGLPWTRARRRMLMASRVETTQAFAALAARLDRPPRVLISASAIGYYGIHGDEVLDEQTPPQPIFQSQLCQEWERAADAAAVHGVRVVTLRFGLVLGRDGGALPSLVRSVRMGLGAIIANGHQWMSWIHIDDAINLIDFCLHDVELRGAVNAVAPQAVTQRAFQEQLARLWHRPLWLKIPGPVLRLTLGEMAPAAMPNLR